MALDAANPDSDAAGAAHRDASLGIRIIKLRNERGWTQKELARRAGLRPARLSTLESGTKRPNLQEFARLAEVLDSSMDALWSGERHSPRPKTLELVQKLEELGSPEELAGLGRLLQILLLGYRAALGPASNRRS
jgi:HTH-type transcriptional regulator/antitoxin HipB